MNHLKTLSTARLFVLTRGFAKATLSVIALGVVTVGSANAETIYSQAFDAETPAQLNGTAVSVGTGTWKASAFFQTDGTLSESTRSMALLSFTPEVGKIYELSLTIDNLESGFMGIGFADDISFTGGNANNDRMITGNAINYGMMFLNPFQLATNGMAYSTYSSAANILDTNVFLGDPAIVDPPTPPTAGAGPYTLKIVMDTTDTNWTTEYFIDGVSKQFFEHAGALSNIDSVGINTGIATTATTFSNFSLTVVPEPGSLALIGLGGLMMLRRRR